MTICQSLKRYAGVNGQADLLIGVTQVPYLVYLPLPACFQRPIWIMLADGLAQFIISLYQLVNVRNLTT